MNETKVVNNLVAAVRKVKAESKGTVDAYSNRDGGNLTLRKLFGTATISDLDRLATSTQASFRHDVLTVAKAHNPQATVTEYEPDVSGFSQGGYVQCVVNVEKLGAEVWKLLEDLVKTGYRIKR